jgi:hypothetical protein
LLQGFVAIGGLAHDFDVRLALQDHLNASTEEGVVVDDEDPDGLGVGAKVGDQG